MSNIKLKNDNNFFMEEALKQARLAEKAGEVPVGAVIVKDGVIIARAYNSRITDKDAAAHAEINAIRAAGEKLDSWHLDGCVIYVTLEPCAMCAGALINSRIKELVYGASDERFGCCGSVYNIPEDGRFNHTLKVTKGIMRDECAGILSAFFKAKRAVKKEQAVK